MRRVAVLMGGISPEHPVSLASGCGVLSQLDPALYRGFPVLISRDNVWTWPANPSRFPVDMTVEQAESWLKQPPEGWERAAFGERGEMLRFPQADVFFLALHGVGGEDGTLQAFLEEVGQPFTGSGSAASRLSMDKIESKERYRAHGIPTAPWIVFAPEEYADAAGAADRVERELGLPAVVKHPEGGSSIGVAVAKTRAELEKAIVEIGADAPRLLVEGFVAGREATCGVLEGHASSVPPTEIRPKKDGFFSFEEKYRKDGAEEITPAEFPPAINAAIQAYAAKAHAALGLSVYSRTDFIWTGADKDSLFALETNNLPGFTPKSILPQQAAAIGMSYRDLVTFVIEASMKARDEE
ncbi:MAG TPA: D-alanine--D-alanine ligase [Fibrobacteria bacterium]|jgi:D-alanine-D-alanine ligase|nr:D-alanine--D-alanine ligase [Fibrobacteria bacterium]